MKKLLWLISISCFLPAVTGMPSQASSLDTGIAEVEADKAVDGFLNSHSRSTEVSTAAVENFATNTVVDRSLDILSPSGVATQPSTVQKRADKSATGREKIANSKVIQPVSDKNSGFIAQAPSVVPAPSEAPAPSGTPAPSEAPAPSGTPAPSEAPAPSVVPAPSGAPAPSSSDQSVSDLDRQLEEVKKSSASSNNFFEFYSPALTINNPAGFGADSNTLFLLGSVQFPSRANATDGEIGIGVGLGDAWNAIGAELSYTIYSVRGQSQGFGSGAFNAKLHKRIAEDTAVAIGWNRFADVKFSGGAGLDFDYPKNSYYAVATQIIRTTESIDDVFSRIALTAGVGGGQFLPLDANLSAQANRDRTGIGVFGSAAVRLVRPVSAVVEWTGQDLAAGLSIVPFQGFPLVITPAFRDISGIQGQSARFVLGVSTAIKF
jgi:hypothetical protein